MYQRLTKKCFVVSKTQKLTIQGQQSSIMQLKEYEAALLTCRF